jgi:1-acyl-sn-glycerol-3-phosphate acyltransferase
VQYQLSRIVAGPFLRGLWRPEVTGAEHVPETGGAILASNHLSILDSVFLPFMLKRPVTFTAKSEYFTSRHPAMRLMGRYLRATGQIPVDRDGARAAQATLEAALALLRQGQLFGIYPEGTRSPDGRLYRGRPGVGWLAMNSGLPVIPVAMFGTDRVLPPGHSVPRLGKVRIKIGKPLTFSTETGPASEGKAAPAPGKVRRAIADEVVRAIHELSGQEYVNMYASVRKEQLAAEAAGPAS